MGGDQARRPPGLQGPPRDDRRSAKPRSATPRSPCPTRSSSKRPHQTICTRVQFNAGGGNGEQCPAGSIYGHASATTPILDRPARRPGLPALLRTQAARPGRRPAPRRDRRRPGRPHRLGQGPASATPSKPSPTPRSRTFDLEMQGGKQGPARQLAPTSARRSTARSPTSPATTARPTTPSRSCG